MGESLSMTSFVMLGSLVRARLYHLLGRRRGDADLEIRSGLEQRAILPVFREK